MSHLVFLYLPTLSRKWGRESNEFVTAFTQALTALQPPALAHDALKSVEKSMRGSVDEDVAKQWRACYTKAELEDAFVALVDNAVACTYLRTAMFLSVDVDVDFDANGRYKEWIACLTDASDAVVRKEMQSLGELTRFDNSGIDTTRLLFDVPRLAVATGMLQHAPVQLLRALDFHGPVRDGELQGDVNEFVNALESMVDELAPDRTLEQAVLLAPVVQRHMESHLVRNAPVLCADVGNVVAEMVDSMNDPAA
jgi:hypothetical protein